MPIVQRSYLQPGFPVFSFLYAWYADTEFAKVERDEWERSHDYRGFLDFYKLDPKRSFPPEAEALVAVEVATNPIEPSGLHRPSRVQSWALAFHVMHELANLPGPGPASPPAPLPVDRSPATPSSERPLLSCLACIFLNQDQRFRADVEKFLCEFGLSDESVTTLRAFAASGGEFLTPGQVLSLTTALVDELSRNPATW